MSLGRRSEMAQMRNGRGQRVGPGIRAKLFTRRPGRPSKNAKKVWIGAQFLFGHPPFSMSMKPGNGVVTTKWIIEKFKNDPEPIVIDAPALVAYESLMKMMRDNQ